MIQASNVVKLFDSHTALERVTLAIGSGCIYGLVGTNGSGKSTLLRLIAGVYSPNEGGITLDGAPVFENPEAKKRIFFVSDDLYFQPQAALGDMAEFYRAAYPGWSEERYAHLCEMFPIGTKRKLSTFSKGMRRQAALILALSAQPDYLLLDEAFDGLDPLARLEFKRGLIALNEENGCTAVISSHSLRELEDICSGFALLDGGTVADAGDIQSALEKVHKFQVALPREAKREDFPFECLSFEATGRVAKFIARGDGEQLRQKIAPLSPLFVEEIPVDFEELFLCEVKARGYLQ